MGGDLADPKTYAKTTADNDLKLKICSKHKIQMRRELQTVSHGVILRIISYVSVGVFIGQQASSMFMNAPATYVCMTGAYHTYWGGVSALMYELRNLFC